MKVESLSGSTNVHRIVKFLVYFGWVNGQ